MLGVRRAMKRVISISEIVDSHEVTKGTRDVIATGEARFNGNPSTPWEAVPELPAASAAI